MKSHLHKKKENKNQWFANTHSNKKELNGAIYELNDNRPEVVLQRKLDTIANNNHASETTSIFNDAAIYNSIGTIQAKWRKIRNSGNPGQYYWDGKGQKFGGPPNNAQEVPPPNFLFLPDTHMARSGGSMKSLRTRQDYPEQNLDELAHYAYQASEQRGLFYNEPFEKRGLGPRRVQANVPTRNPSEHRTIFNQMTGGQPSSTMYQQQLGTALPNTSYQILHGFGYGEGGQQTQNPQNLSSASEGANSKMIPFDKMTTGNTSIINNTYARVRPNTHRAESLHLSYAHESFPDTPFFELDIDGDLPKPTRSQYEQWEREVPQIPDDQEEFFASAALFNISRQAPFNYDNNYESMDLSDDNLEYENDQYLDESGVIPMDISMDEEGFN